MYKRQGVLRGSVHLRGARNAPDVEADLSGDALAFGDYRVDRLLSLIHI